MISPNFTLEDIREVRRQIGEETQGMSISEALAYIHLPAIPLYHICLGLNFGKLVTVI